MIHFEVLNQTLSPFQVTPLESPIRLMGDMSFKKCHS